MALVKFHTNTINGFRTALRNFLHLFRGAHERYLSGLLPCASPASI